MSLKLINAEESQTFGNRQEAMNQLKFHFERLLLFSLEIFNFCEGQILLIYQGCEKQVYMGRHDTSFSVSLLVTAHVLFLFSYNYTVFIHLLHFWEKNFTEWLGLEGTSGYI